MKPGATDVVVAIDVGGILVKTAIVGSSGIEVNRVRTVRDGEPWSIDTLVDIAADLCAGAARTGSTPRHLVIAVPGQVDEFHGAVQYSATLPWHDVAVAARVADVVDVEVTVRHSARVAALAESNLVLAGVSGSETTASEATGSDPDVAGVGGPVQGTMLFVSLGAGITAAGAQSGVVVADHVGAGDLGGMRIRSGPGAGKTLDTFASAWAIARRYAEAAGVEPTTVDAAAVHRAIGDDPVAARIWSEAIEALADGLEWSSMLFGPRTIVIGGGLVDAGDDLIVPLVEALSRRIAGRDGPVVRAATFGSDSGWVGAALTGWKKLGWPIASLQRALGSHFATER